MDDFTLHTAGGGGVARETNTLKSQVASKLRDAIICGDYLPGERLNEAQLAKAFQVSRIPIREALIQLWESGLVMQSDKRGHYVTMLSREDIDHINGVRLTLEAEAVSLARKRLSPDIVAKLQNVVDRMKTADTPSFEAAMLDLEFHRLVWRASGNPVLAKVLDRLVAQLFAFKGLAHRDMACTVSSQTRANAGIWRAIQHRDLLDVLIGRSAMDPMEAIRAHMSNTIAQAA